MDKTYDAREMAVTKEPYRFYQVAQKLARESFDVVKRMRPYFSEEDYADLIYAIALSQSANEPRLAEERRY